MRGCFSSRRSARRGSRPFVASLGYTLALALAGCALTRAAHARDVIEWALDGTTGWDQNPGLYAGSSQLGRAGSLTAYTGGSIFYDDATPELRLHLAGTGGYLEYLNGHYPGRTVASIDAQGEYIFDPHFYWTLGETFGQATTNVLAGASSLNSTNVNMFSTGPQFSMPLLSAWQLQLRGSAGAVTYQSRLYPSFNRVTGDAAVVDSISSVSSFSFDGNYQLIEYSGSQSALYGTLTGYDRESIYAHYNIQGVRDYASIDVGEDLVHQGALTNTDPMLRLTLQRNISPHTNIALTASHVQSDASAQFAHVLTNERLPTSLSNINYRPVQQNLMSGPMRVETLIFSSTYQGLRSRLVLDANLGRDDYIDNPQWGSETEGFEANFTRRLRRHLDAKLYASLERDRYHSMGIYENTASAAATLGWQLTRYTQLTFGYRFERRVSNIGQYGYTDNSLYVGFRYSPYQDRGFANGMPTSFSGVGGGAGAQVQFMTPAAGQY